jgi:ABC-type multidrug transport system fused ATPase/permease subunit
MSDMAETRTPAQPLDRVKGQSQDGLVDGGKPPRLAKLRQTADMFGLVRRLIVLAKGHFWFLPGMAVLAVLASVFEGISLTLIIPLIHYLDGGSGPLPAPGRMMSFLNGLTDLVPVQSRLLAIVIAILGAVVIKSIISYANASLLGVVYGRISHALRTRIFARIIDMPLAEFESDRSGRLLNILNQETWRATDALRSMFTIVINAATIAVLTCILLFLSWRLSLLALGCIAVIAPFAHAMGARAKALSKEGIAETEILSKTTWTALNGMRMIHAFGCEKSEVRRFEKSSDRVRSLFLKMAKYTMATAPVAEVAITAVIALLLLFVQASGLSIGAFAGFLVILYRLQPRVLALASAHTSLLALHANILAVSETLSKPTETATSTGRPFSGLRKGLSFENVTFTYKGSPEPALVNVSFRIPKGSVIAVVGKSGAGKSTLIDLILRFQKAQQGRILVDDIALSELDVTSWRAGLGVVNQDPYIFDDTVAANLSYGTPSATHAEIVEAAQLACADDFIRTLPQGYDTIVGERGTQLSGGQRQRIALARALLRHPDILILDEATNALDATTERAFQHALAAYAKHRTVIIVAHRLATIEDADHVIVLEAGRVVEQGPPAMLLKAGRAFARNFGGQMSPLLDRPSAQASAT